MSRELVYLGNVFRCSDGVYVIRSVGGGPAVAVRIPDGECFDTMGETWDGFDPELPIRLIFTPPPRRPITP
jgi:hypothetical protein